MRAAVTPDDRNANRVTMRARLVPRKHAMSSHPDVRTPAVRALASRAPESIILKIGGWETDEMFRRYATTDTQKMADNLGS